ncbi:hypothetical protein F5148DRAFT_1317361 [Russula earlei]|uniref:Uncharacterized protein n=1 Tax=Russula earlei TaxID=71964 RepID=A0ACC0U593_9AGAM|nr:hypothetical protein F5148DRAFT_1317361 [Russula earlei]
MALKSTERVEAEKRTEAGNAHFRAGEYLKAIVEYDAAIMIHSSNSAYLSNMAAAWLKYDHAEASAGEALVLDPRFTKARYRRGLARKGNLELARAAWRKPLHGYRKALALAMHKPTTPSTSVDNAMLPSAELTTQCDKANGTPETAAAEAAAMRCTTTRHDDRMEHALVHTLPLSTTG